MWATERGGTGLRQRLSQITTGPTIARTPPRRLTTRSSRPRIPPPSAPPQSANPRSSSRPPTGGHVTYDPAASATGLTRVAAKCFFQPPNSVMSLAGSAACPSQTKPTGLVPSVRSTEVTEPRWAALTRDEVRERAASARVAVLPVGATEQHGPHLSTGTDTLLGERIALAAVARTGDGLLPAFAYGCSLGHTDAWPGTISLHPATMTAVVIEIGRWVHASGFRRLVILNSHATNGAPCQSAILQLRYELPDLRLRLGRPSTCRRLYSPGSLRTPPIYTPMRPRRR